MTSETKKIWIEDLAGRVGDSVTLHGWLANKRSSGKIAFLQVRDGSGVVQAVAGRADVSETAWDDIERVTQESTVRVTGTVKEDKRSPSGVEIQADRASRSLDLTAGLPDHPQGARHRVPDGAPPPLAALQRASAPRCGCAARSSRRSATSSTSATSS